MSRLVVSIVAVAAIALVLTSAAGAAAAPLYDVKATWGPTNLPTGGVGQFIIQVRNIGDEGAEKKLFISDELPAGIKVTNLSWENAVGNEDLSQYCSILASATAVSCVIPAGVTPEVAPPPNTESTGTNVNPEPSGYLLPLFLEVMIEAEGEQFGTNVATVAGGGAPMSFTDEDQVHLGATSFPFGIVANSFLADAFTRAYPDGSTSRQAGDHPFEFRTDFNLTAKSVVSLFDSSLETPPSAGLRTADVTLPRGFVGNPEALPKCNPVQFAQIGATNNATRCPANTQVGFIDIDSLPGEGNHGNGIQSFMPTASALLSRIPIYNLKPPKGTLADLAFSAQGGLVVSHIYATIGPAPDYAINTVAPNASTAAPVNGAEVTIWGVPGDPAHNKFRYFAANPANNPEKLGLGASFVGPVRPFLTNAMDCQENNGGAQIRVESYEQPKEFSPTQEYPSALNVTGCDDPRFRFNPEITLQPTDHHAGSPTGLAVHLKVQQQDDEVQDPKELYMENGAVKAVSSPPIKRVTVALPTGMTLNPSAAQGLGSCSASQIGIETNDPIQCPDSSQYGTLTLHSPYLPASAQPEGRIFIARQSDNPFGSFLALYLVIEDSDLGLRVKIPGKVALDKETGQITTSFDSLPQFPVSDMQLNLKGGVRAGLVEPSTCGSKTITAEFFSWQEPDVPRVVQNSYDITEKPDGSPCVRNLGERPFRPTLEAGTTNNTAGEYSPFAFRLTRTDDDQEFSQVGVTLPTGLAAKFAGVGQCSDAAIAQAEGRREAGEGALEQMSPSCPASSLIGSTEVGTGVGVPLTFVPGKVYLGGPYRGAPLSMVVISPAVVGPFDLGVVVVRTALHVDPVTAQGSAASDAFPQIFQGIPVRIRDIRLNLDRSGFTLNPTSCAEKQISAHITGTGGVVSTTADDTAADLSNRFQAADCASLGFKPKLAFRLAGGTRRGGHPKLQARVTYPKYGAYSNVAAASVALPHSEFLDQGHIGTVCTRVQFAAKQCPAASVYGWAVAKSPLFDFPLEGPVYLRSSSHELPDVVAALKGPASMPIEVDLDGRVDSVNGGIRNRFAVVPDAPVEFFTLTLKGARKGLLVNSTDICAKTYRATAKFTAQNGRRLIEHPALKATCPKARPHPRR